MKQAAQSRVEFSDFTFDHEKFFLRHRGEAVPLKKQSAEVLALLLRNAGEVVSRDEIRRHVWDGRVIEFDQGINACIRDIRHALGDNPRKPQFVETHPRVGYRFLQAVRPQAAVRLTRRLRWPLVATALAIVILALIIDGIRPVDSPIAGKERIAVMPFRTLEDEDDGPFDGEAARLTDLFVLQLSQKQSRALVISASDLFGVDHPDPGMGDVSRWLEADYLLAGAVHRVDNVATLSLRLVRTDGYVHLWSKSIPINAAEPEELERLIPEILAAMDETG